MPVRRPVIICLICVAGAAFARADGGLGATPDRSPLPHPDILQVSPAPSKRSSTEARVAAPVAASPESAAAPVAKVTSDVPNTSGASPAAKAEQDQVIARPAGRAGVSTAGVGATGNVGRGASGTFSLVSELWPLMVVLALIGGGAMFLKKYLPKSRLSVGSDVLRVVARTSVGPKQQLMLVKLGRRLLLLGVSPERMNALTTVDDPDQVAMLLGEAARAQPDSMTQAFAASINHESAAYEAETGDEDATETTRGHVQGLLQKVRQLAGKGG
jgi:flagellar biosynthetic protein FliO